MAQKITYLIRECGSRVVQPPESDEQTEKTSDKKPASKVKPKSEGKKDAS